MARKGCIVVLGSGAAGRAAARSLAAAGWEVILAEEGRVGGTCLWRGCIPKKALYTSASALREAQRGAQFGLDCHTPSIDWQAALAWKWHAEETFAGDQKALLESRGIRIVEGRARFVSDREVQIGLERYEFDHAVIATGARPSMPAGLCGCELADTSSDVLRYPEPPESLSIVGAGFIALEMAGIFASLGTKVTVIGRGSRILPMLDADLAAIAEAALAELGVTFLNQTNAVAIERRGNQLALEIAAVSGGERATHTSERILIATGSTPALDALDLSEADIALTAENTLDLTPELRTTNPRVWACGDATGSWMHTPAASLEGRLVAASIDSGKPHRPDYSCLPITCFTVPQLAIVGLSEAEAAERGIATRVSRVRAADIGAAIVGDERNVLYKLITAEKDGRILGAQVAGSTASDSIYAAAVAIRAGMTAAQLQEVPAVHPSFAEGVFYSAW
ncbi:MAG: dihydrolipoyl dehydrogenase family protein [Coriobacteriia bacterium]